MKKTCLALGLAMLAAGIAAAETTNTTLTTPPGCYLGSGCDPNGWAVSNDGSTELGLTAIIYRKGAPGDNNLGPTNVGYIDGNTYYIPAGGSSYSANYALWNFSWSIYTDLNGPDSRQIVDNTYLLTIADLTLGTSYSFDPTNPLLGDAPTDSGAGAQNSENPNFGFIKTPLQFNYANGDNYEITLTETGNQSYNAGYSNSDTIFVDVMTPEPSTMSLAALSVVGLWFLRRRQMRRSS